MDAGRRRVPGAGRLTNIQFKIMAETAKANRR